MEKRLVYIFTKNKHTNQHTHPVKYMAQWNKWIAENSLEIVLICCFLIHGNTPFIPLCSKYFSIAIKSKQKRGMEKEEEGGGAGANGGQGDKGSQIGGRG